MIIRWLDYEETSNLDLSLPSNLNPLFIASNVLHTVSTKNVEIITTEKERTYLVKIIFEHPSISDLMRKLK